MNKVDRQKKLLETAAGTASAHKESLVTIKRLLDALHAHHYNDESPANCAACRKVLAP